MAGLASSVTYLPTHPDRAREVLNKNIRNTIRVIISRRFFVNKHLVFLGNFFFFFLLTSTRTQRKGVFDGCWKAEWVSLHDYIPTTFSSLPSFSVSKQEANQDIKLFLKMFIYVRTFYFLLSFQTVEHLIYLSFIAAVHSSCQTLRNIDSFSTIHQRFVNYLKPENILHCKNLFFNLF